jgi:hypothetical protein
MVLLVNLLLICLSRGHAGTDESLELRVGRLFRVGHNRSLDLPRASDRTCTTMLSMSMSGGGRCKVIRLLRRKRGEDGGLDVGRRSGIGALSVLRIILLALGLLLLLRIILLWLVIGDRGLLSVWSAIDAPCVRRLGISATLTSCLTLSISILLLLLRVWTMTRPCDYIPSRICSIVSLNRWPWLCAR